MDQLDQQAALDYVLSLAQKEGEANVDLIYERSEKLSLNILNGKADKVHQSTGLGLGIRVVHNGRTGIASTEHLQKTALEKAFLTAKENARISDPTEVILPTKPPQLPNPSQLKLFNADIEGLSLEELSSFGLDIEARVHQIDKRVISIPYLGLWKSNSEYHILSSQGVNYQQKQNAVGAYCGPLLEEGERRKSGSHSWSERSWNPSQSQMIGDMAVKDAADLLMARPIPGGQVPVVLDEYCAPRLLGMYLSCFSAEAAQKGLSRLQGRLGEMIANESLDIISDPHLLGGAGSCYMDGEGVPTQKISLVTQGRFEDFMYHIESARKEGRESNGHAGRNYKSGISTTTHNIVIPKGSYTLDELVALPEKCLLVTKLEGAAGCDPLSGDISIGIQGFWIEKGQRQQAVDNVTIAGNFFDVLKSIKALGNIYHPNLSQIFIPPVLIEGLTLSS